MIMTVTDATYTKMKQKNRNFGIIFFLFDFFIYYFFSVDNILFWPIMTLVDWKKKIYGRSYDIKITVIE